MLISLLEVCQEWRSKRGLLEGSGELLTGDFEDMAIADVVNDLSLPKGRYTKNFVLISLLEVCQEWGVKKGVLGVH